MKISKSLMIVCLLALVGGCSHSARPLSRMENRRSPLILDRSESDQAMQGEPAVEEHDGFFLWNWL